MPEFTVPTGRPVGKMVVQSGSVVGSGETSTSKAGVEGARVTAAAAAVVGPVMVVVAVGLMG